MNTNKEIKFEQQNKTQEWKDERDRMQEYEFDEYEIIEELEITED